MPFELMSCSRNYSCTCHSLPGLVLTEPIARCVTGSAHGPTHHTRITHSHHIPHPYLSPTQLCNHSITRSLVHSHHWYVLLLRSLPLLYSRWEFRQRVSGVGEFDAVCKSSPWAHVLSTWMMSCLRGYVAVDSHCKCFPWAKSVVHLVSPWSLCMSALYYSVSSRWKISNQPLSGRPMIKRLSLIHPFVWRRCVVCGCNAFVLLVTYVIERLICQ